jgi:hypothetical protein
MAADKSNASILHRSLSRAQWVLLTLLMAGGASAGSILKSFTAQAGVNYDVYLETHPGVGIG